MRRGNLISYFYNDEKMRSSRPLKTRAQDDGNVKRCHIFRIDGHAIFVASDEDKNRPPHPNPLPRRGEGKNN